MSIQERFESVQATIDTKIKNKDLPKGVYVATGAVDVVSTRVSEIPAHVDAVRAQAIELRTQVEELPTTVWNTHLQHRSALQERIAAVPAEMRAGVDRLAKRGDDTLTRRQSQRAMQARLDAVSDKLTPFAARIGVVSRDAGVKVSETAKKASEATQQALADEA
jgi:DNA topoisomerase VI subunit B